VLTFYSVVAGWVLYFIGATAVDWFGALFSGQPLAGAFADGTVEEIQEIMPTLFADPVRLLAMHFIFACLTIYVVARGVNRGIEKAATWLMPAFFVLLLIITLYSAFTGDFAAAVTFLFAPDFSRVLDPAVLNSALGQAFFSLSLGSAIMITYGAYASQDTNLSRTSGMIAAADTSVAIIAGLAIFPIVFAVGLDPAAGPTLMFQTLPSAFHTMPAGALVALLFFILVFFAALTSSVSLLEVVVAWLSERFGVRGLGWPRCCRRELLRHRPVCGIRLQHLGTSPATVLCPRIRERQLVRRVRRCDGRILLPLSGLITALFIGWVADRRLVDPETGLGATGLLPVWRFLVAWLCPATNVSDFIWGGTWNGEEMMPLPADGDRAARHRPLHDGRPALLSAAQVAPPSRAVRKDRGQGGGRDFAVRGAVDRAFGPGRHRQPRRRRHRDRAGRPGRDLLDVDHRADRHGAGLRRRFARHPLPRDQTGRRLSRRPDEPTSPTASARKWTWLAILFCDRHAVSALVTGNMIQANAVGDSSSS
jgi:neurotransmitter:Na+ symporter, NSS family